MSAPLLPTRFLFRFSATCRQHDPQKTEKGYFLDESFRLPNLAELEGRAPWADVRAAWSTHGLSFCLIVEGKTQPPWCRASKIEDSDSLQIWIDTRDVHNVHRASRFCQRFIFLPEPQGAAPISRHSPGGASHKPASTFSPAPAESLPINRAKEPPHPVRQGILQARCRLTADGYILEAFIPAEALTGFDTVEHPRLGFTYAVIDRELGEQTFGVGNPMPYQEDPSLWATLELIK
jgi:hypothetical protein